MSWPFGCRMPGCELRFIKFGAVVYHLHHKVADLSAVPANEEKLLQTIAQGVTFVPAGMNNYTSPQAGLKHQIMNESKRQKQIGGLLNEELNDIFRRLGLNMLDGGMVSISSVKITPDLLEARVYREPFPGEGPKGSNEKDRRQELGHQT